MIVKTNTENIDCYAGDIVMFEFKPCLVVRDIERGEKLLIQLGGVGTGDVVARFPTYSDIDKVVQKVLIKEKDVIIQDARPTGEIRSVEECPF